MKRYFELTENERVELDDQALSDAIKREAINRGIAPPLTLDESLKRGQITSYQHPADFVKFYEIMRPNKYHGQDRTGIAFATEEEAVNAMRGAFAVVSDGYSGSKDSLANGTFSVQVVLIGSTSKTVAQKKVEEYESESEAFDEVAAECVNNLTEIRQRRYDAAVNQRKREEYLRLANGDESIAKAFWSKTEKIEWPSE